MAGTSAQVTFAFLAKDAASKTVRGLTKTLGTLGKVSSGIGKKLKTGLLGVGAGLIGLAAGATAAAVAFTKGAIDDEKANARLIAVLKQRKLATEANLAAVDALITKGADLAFTDDQIRESLGTATQFTKDFTQAQKILATAQDLARAKNIDLGTATTIVGKAFAGNTVALGRMGVQLKKGAKGTEALAGINAKFGGSAQAYAETTAGSMEALQISLSEMGEEIGYTLIPIVHDLVKAFRDNVLPVLRTVVDGVKKFISENKGMISGVLKTVGALAAKLAPILQKVGQFLFEKVIPGIVGFVNKLTAPGGVMDSVGKVVGPILEKLIPAFGKIFDEAGKVIDAVGRLAAALWGDGTGPLAAGVKLLGSVFEVFLGILGNVLGLIEKIIDATAKAITFIIKLADEQRKGAEAKYTAMGGVAPVQLGGAGFSTGSGAVAPSFNQYYNVYVGADKVADAVVPVLGSKVTNTPRGGR